MENENANANSASMDPNSRIKTLSEYGNAVEVDKTIQPKMYYRSGLEMVRMANVYLEEGCLENAYILYMKFMTLFIEKIREHPNFASVSAADRASNAQKLREVLPKAEKLKSQLLERYTKEYQKYLEEKKRRDDERALLAQRQAGRRQAEDAPRDDPGLKLHLAGHTPLVVSPPLPTDSVRYDMLDTDKPAPALPSPSLSSVPSFDRSMKPMNLLTPTLRNVIVPSQLIEKFKNLAQRNTEKNIETCGILAGKLGRNVLTITHLILPKQTGTPDSCSTTDEVEVDRFQRDQDLITLGWIHTHPTQTAFLSSVDLHTHYSYQCLMSEAVAIVCAPSYHEDATFMLTQDYGLNYIRNCTLTGFHPHPTHPPLYEEAAHCRVDSTAPVKVIDLR
ncbi:STAM-binding protein-like [Bacillus rossius redtenbacheri]|uniref:STAM-binding protein-like n=1 Tax=Bacillus rossius redtenbacheri TaxID=93214 RepID=UPI002FDE5569